VSGARGVALALLAAALLLRVGLVIATPHYRLGSDAADYDRHARSLAAGHGYPASTVAPGGGPTALRPPGYPVFAGAVYLVTGPRPNAVRLVQALLGALTAALTGLLAARVWGTRAGLFALGVAAVFPPLLAIGTAVTPEALFLPLELAAVLALLVHRDGRRLRWALAAGALAGLAILTRQNGAVILIPLALGAWGLPPRRSARGAAPAVALLAAAALVVAPWTVRNALVLHAFVPVSTQSGYTLAGTYSDETRNARVFPGAWRAPVRLGAQIARDGAPRTEVEFGAELGQAARDYARAHPGYVAAVTAGNLARMNHLDGFAYGRAAAAAIGIPRALADLAIVTFWIAAALALVALVRPGIPRAAWPLWAVPVLVVLASAPIIGEPRFRAPLDPLVAALAAVTLARFFAATFNPVPRGQEGRE
jgi:hypothetical protein